jgi:hypothetical protein
VQPVADAVWNPFSYSVPFAITEPHGIRIHDNVIFVYCDALSEPVRYAQPGAFDDPDAERLTVCKHEPDAYSHCIVVAVTFSNDEPLAHPICKSNNDAYPESVADAQCDGKPFSVAEHQSDAVTDSVADTIADPIPQPHAEPDHQSDAIAYADADALP